MTPYETSLDALEELPEVGAALPDDPAETRNVCLISLVGVPIG
ncbi:hypothetical protein AB0K89_04070 [Streptomyces cinnamoneus]